MTTTAEHDGLQLLRSGFPFFRHVFVAIVEHPETTSSDNNATAGRSLPLAAPGGQGIGVDFCPSAAALALIIIGLFSVIFIFCWLLLVVYVVACSLLLFFDGLSSW